MTPDKKTLWRKKKARRKAEQLGHRLSATWTVQLPKKQFTVRSKFCVRCWYFVHFWRDNVWGNAVKIECPTRRFK